jgi:crossover junction endodeoxyribonuclease RuvC
MIALGIDPGTAITGYGVVEERHQKFIYLSHGVIRTSNDMSDSRRLAEIYQNLTKIIKAFKPDAVIIEELFFNKNVTTAISVGQARGVAMLAAAKSNIEVKSYTPLQVKQAIAGYGKAEKNQIQNMVKILLGLDEVPKPDDAADALALALCHLSSQKMEQMTKIPNLKLET